METLTQEMPVHGPLVAWLARIVIGLNSLFDGLLRNVQYSLEWTRFWFQYGLTRLDGVVQEHAWEFILALSLALAFSIFIRRTNAVMFTEFFRTKKWRPHAYIGGSIILASLWTQVQLDVQFNAWYKAFYDIINDAQHHTLQEYWSSLAYFMYLVIPYVAILSMTKYLSRRYGLWWRTAINNNYVPRMKNVSEKIEGESQRIQEDPQLFAEIVENLTIQFVQAAMTLIAFLPIFWVLSEQVKLEQLIPMFPVGAQSTFAMIFGYIPRPLVVIALCSSLGGMVVTWFVSIKLPKLQYNNQVVEAEYRKALVLLEDNKQSAYPVALLFKFFLGINLNYKRLYLHQGYNEAWTALYGQIMIIVPYIIVGPGLFGPHPLITLGTLIMVTNSFGKVNDSVSVILNNWSVITKLRSVWRRLREFESGVRTQESRIGEEPAT